VTLLDLVSTLRARASTRPGGAEFRVRMCLDGDRIVAVVSRRHRQLGGVWARRALTALRVPLWQSFWLLRCILPGGRAKPCRPSLVIAEHALEGPSGERPFMERETTHAESP
jgi:hypothetical protein